MGSTVEARLTDAGLTIARGGVPWVRGMGIEFPYAGEDRSSFTGGFVPVDARPVEGRDEIGDYSGHVVTYAAVNTPIVAVALRAYPARDLVTVTAEALVELTGIERGDSFLRTTFNAPVLRLRDGGFLLYTWGLSDAGSEWPHAVYGEDLGSVPRDRPFSPFVLVGDDGAMVVSPGSHYPVSPLRAGPAPGTIARGLHGAIDRIPRGTTVTTVIAFGDDPSTAMLRWGDHLRAGRARPGPLDDRVLSRLGYWNNYGAYYSELLHPIDEGTLRALGDYFHREGIPIGYFGLDLWYPHDRVGFATAYRADPRRFPSGLGRIRDRTGIPFFLHLSGFDSANEYRDGYSFFVGDGAACPREAGFYSDLGHRLQEEEGAIGVWHDHIRVYQERIPELRTSLTAAEEWFTGMATAIGDTGLPLMLSDPTGGFLLLAAARARSVIACRSGDDYLVKQPGQLAQLDPVAAARYRYVPPQRFIVDRFLVGWLLYSLGLLPFHDVFITNRDHPDGFAEPDADAEALMRALSAGPVGIGDKLGAIDADLVRRLVFPDGVLAKPDHPPRPAWGALARGLIVGEATSVGGAWRYLAVFNVADGDRVYDLHDLGIAADGRAIYSHSHRGIAPALRGSLSPAAGDYYVLAPVVDGIAFIGFIDKYITAPTDRIIGLEASGSGLEARMRVPPGHPYPVGAFARDGGEITATAVGARVVERSVRAGMHVFTIRPEAEECTLHLRRTGGGG